MGEDARPLRLGRIEFLNCVPIEWGLEATGGLDGIEVAAASPDALSDDLVAGVLDVGPISLVEALRHADDLVIFPEPAVIARGKVGSVCVVSRRPLAALDGARIALGSTSRTSVELGRLWLEQRWGVRAEYVVQPPDLAARLADADAAVVIGDLALRASLAPAPGIEVHDLGLAWQEWQGLPMVFAVWAARRAFAERRQAEVDVLRTRLAQALDHSERAASAMVRAAADRSGLPEASLAAYFAGLDFRLSSQSWRGIERFRDLLVDAGRIPPAGPLKLLDGPPSI